MTGTTSSTTKYSIALIAGLSLVGALAGCSAPAADTGSDTGSTPDAPARDYADGTYTESGDYSAPSGTETVEVTITLADNIITAVDVVGDATDPEARLHQGEFIDGIQGVVVGKNIDEIQVDKVGGSSLTSGGFNRAIDAIKADAAE
ncbi:MAG: FMN-binding protein [Rhodoglobus sp.]|nr:FMN-binding protein [Rhodoglobus sp.]